MDTTYPNGSEGETQRAHAFRKELAERIARATPKEGTVEPLQGLHLNRSSTPTDPLHGVSQASFCVIAQGSEEALLGNSRYRYGATYYLLATVELPVVSRIIKALVVGMSVSGFHHPFKGVTAMSPLQFQKQFRLQEARRLLLGEKRDAASAGHRVGHDDASPFRREYKRLFGQPPMRNVERLRAAARR